MASVVVRKIGVGRQAEVYEGDNGLAVKVYNSSVSINHIKYEADISERVAEVCIKAPRFYGIWNQDDRYGLQFELIEGEMLSTQMSRHILDIRRYSREIAKLHSEIHKNSITGLHSTIDKFEWRLRQYKNLDSNVLKSLLEFIKNSQTESLCHGDLHPDNIIVNKHDEMRIVDWVDAYCGNPLSDVARTYYLLSKGVSPEKKPYFVRIIESIARKIIAKEYLHSYFGNKPIPKREFDIWQLIIQICRCTDGIEEEKAYLQRSIPHRINKLMPFIGR